MRSSTMEIFNNLPTTTSCRTGASVSSAKPAATKHMLSRHSKRSFSRGPKRKNLPASWDYVSLQLMSREVQIRKTRAAIFTLIKKWCWSRKYSWEVLVMEEALGRE